MHFYLVCSMNKFRRVFVLCVLAVAATGAAEIKSKSQLGSKIEKESKAKEQTTKATPTNHASAHAVVSHGAFGIASIAGVDSRNGRRSSISSVQFYPPLDSSMIKSDSKGNYVLKSVDGKMPMPLTITKQGDGISGTIKIMPGSVSVSSSSSNGVSASAVSGPQVPDFSPLPMSFMKPMMKDIFFSDPFFKFPSISNSAYYTGTPSSEYRTRISNLSHNKKTINSPYHTKTSDSAYRAKKPNENSAFYRISEPSFPSFPEPSFAMIPEPIFPSMPDPWMEEDTFKQTLPRYNTFGRDYYYPGFIPFFNFW